MASPLVEEFLRGTSLELLHRYFLKNRQFVRAAETLYVAAFDVGVSPSCYVARDPSDGLAAASVRDVLSERPQRRSQLPWAFRSSLTQ